MTLIGYETSTLANSAQHGVGNQWRRNAGFMLENSIVMGFKSGLLLDGCQSETKYLGSSPVDSLKFNLVHAYNSNAAFTTTNACFAPATFLAKATTAGTGCGFENNKAFIGANANDSILLVNPFDRSAGFGFYQPAAGSPALTGFTACGLPGLPNCCSFDFATGGSFRGAFGPDEDDDWAFGWTKF
jgi:hypothetical protein